jgi:hypothetical protein
LFALTALACGDGHDNGGTTTVVPPNDRDAGSDAAQASDAGDAATDAADAAPEVDSGPPLELPEGLAGHCVSPDDRVYTIAEQAAPFPSAPLAVDPKLATYAMPYVKTGACLDAIYWASLANDSSATGPTDNLAFDGCSLVRDSAATAVGTGQWLLASVDNREAPYDVWVTMYAGSDATGAQATRLSQNSHVETALALTALQSGDKVALAYADEDEVDGQALYVRMLDTQGQPLGDAVTIEQSTTLYYHGLSIRPLGTDGAVLAYLRYSLDYATSDIMLVALDSSGNAQRAPWVLTSKAGPSASVDVTWNSEGGGVVYSRAEASTGRQIWFQQIDETGVAALQRDGRTRAPALRVVNAPRRGIDVSVTKLLSTFVMAYRELPDPASTETRARLRVYFLDRYGAVIGSSDVGYTSSGGGRTSILSANDGSIVMSWNQVNDDGGSSLRVLRLPCVGG